MNLEWFPTGDEKGVDAEQLIIQSYEEAFQRIQQVTGEEDIEVIVENFCKNEDENFALFNYVNELNSEVSWCMSVTSQKHVQPLFSNITLHNV